MIDYTSPLEKSQAGSKNTSKKTSQGRSRKQSAITPHNVTPLFPETCQDRQQMSTPIDAMVSLSSRYVSDMQDENESLQKYIKWCKQVRRIKGISDKQKLVFIALRDFLEDDNLFNTQWHTVDIWKLALLLSCHREQIGQALINLAKNTDLLERRQYRVKEDDSKKVNKAVTHVEIRLTTIGYAMPLKCTVREASKHGGYRLQLKCEFCGLVHDVRKAKVIKGICTTTGECFEYDYAKEKDSGYLRLHLIKVPTKGNLDDIPEDNTSDTTDSDYVHYMNALELKRTGITPLPSPITCEHCKANNGYEQWIENAVTNRWKCRECMSDSNAQVRQLKDIWAIGVSNNE